MLKRAFLNPLKLQISENLDNVMAITALLTEEAIKAWGEKGSFDLSRFTHRLILEVANQCYGIIDVDVEDVYTVATLPQQIVDVCIRLYHTCHSFHPPGLLRTDPIVERGAILLLQQER